MKIDDLIQKINDFKKKASNFGVDPWLGWTAAVHLGKFSENLRRMDKINHNFALAAAKEKLDNLKQLEQNKEKSKNITLDFNDAYIGMFNLGITDEGRIIRSSQPSRENIGWLKEDYKVRAVINLRKTTEYWEGYTAADEEEACLTSWIEHVQHPMETLDVPPSKEVIEDLLKKIDFFMKPVLIHDGDGKDSVSIVVGAYQLSRLGMKWEDVLEEAVFYGFDPDVNPNMTELIKSFSKE